MDIHAQVDQLVSRIEHRYNNNSAQAKVITFGRRPYNPRRRMAPLNDRVDAAANWLVVAFVLGCLVFIGIGIGQSLLWLGKVVRG